MKLATLNDGTRDGRLVVVSRDLRRAVGAGAVTPTLQAALDDWARCEPGLRLLAESLESGAASGAFPFDARHSLAPLPRTAQFVDASAFACHHRIMSTAYQVQVKVDPDHPVLIQRQGDDFRPGHADYELLTENDDADFEGEFAVCVGDVPMGSSPEKAQAQVRLLLMMNDMSLRRRVFQELSTGWGVVHGKPATVFAPVAVTPDELGASWHDGRVGLDLHVWRNGDPVGHPNGSEMSYSFGRLLAELATTRNLRAGAVLGSGTVSNERASEVGSATIAEQRAIEQIAHGKPVTPWLRFGDRLVFDARDAQGNSIFGSIDQRIVRAALG